MLMTNNSVGNIQQIDVTPYDRTMGDANAPVTLIEYASPSCPVCARFQSVAFPRIKAAYIDTGKVRYVLRVFPLRPEDGMAEKIARCLPPNKYFDVFDLLLSNQPIWDPENGVQDVRGGLVQVGRLAGLTDEQAKECIDSTALDGIMNAIARDGAQKYNVNGTPTFIIDGIAQKSGVIPFDTLAGLLDAELAKRPNRI
jgi:protein-disulfide isomerase